MQRSQTTPATATANPPRRTMAEIIANSPYRQQLLRELELMRAQNFVRLFMPRVHRSACSRSFVGG